MATSRRGKPRGPGPHPDLRDEPAERVEAVGSIVRQLLSGSRMRRGMAIGRLVRAWERVVGTRLAQETAPVEVEGGALLVAASTGAWAQQVSFLAREIVRRANDELGAKDVRTVRVVVRSDAGKPLRDSGFHS
ncbi:MAG TPA: DUF721 domain-containing protein [Actinomycetota bacterium]|nr:DUF721 domain-containing protein [Actinomycetota bacterium]